MMTYICIYKIGHIKKSIYGRYWFVLAGVSYCPRDKCLLKYLWLQGWDVTKCMEIEIPNRTFQNFGNSEKGP